jgi:hypothetical protein
MQPGMSCRASAAPNCHSERAQPPTVIPSERSPQLSFRASAASRGIGTLRVRDRCATCFHAEAQRCAEAQRTALGFEIRSRNTAPLHPRSQQKILGSAFSRSWRRGLARSSPSSAAPRDQQSKGQSNGNSISRGAAEARRTTLRVEITVCCKARLHPQLQTEGLWGSAFSRYRRRGLSESSAPLRPSPPLRQQHVARRSTPRLCVKNTLRDGARRASA